MSIAEKSEYFKSHLEIKIDEVFSSKKCREIISKYENALHDGVVDESVNEILEESTSLVLVDDVNGILTEYFQSEYQLRWPRFDVVDSSASQYYYSDRWHLDGGMPKMLKLFIYLNSVEEHGGNTLIIDQDRTDHLRKAGGLLVEGKERKEDLAPALREMGLSTRYLAYDLKAGDALLFSPLMLAHRCLPPRSGEKRYTICFHVTPPI